MNCDLLKCRDVVLALCNYMLNDLILLPARFIQIREGCYCRDFLIVNNHSYAKRYLFKDGERWTCTKRISRMCDAYVVLDLNRHVIAIRGHHGHLPDQFIYTGGGVYVRKRVRETNGALNYAWMSEDWFQWGLQCLITSRGKCNAQWNKWRRCDR